MKERPKITRPEDLQLLAGLTLRAEMRLETVSVFGLVAVSIVDAGGVGGLCLVQGAKVYALDRDGAFRSVELDFESLGPLCGPERLFDVEGFRLGLLDVEGKVFLARRWLEGRARLGSLHVWAIDKRAVRTLEIGDKAIESVAAAVSKQEEPRRPVAGETKKAEPGLHERRSGSFGIDKGILCRGKSESSLSKFI